MQSILGRKRYRVHNEVQLAPLFSDAVKDRFQLSWNADVKRHYNRRLERACQRIDVFFGFLVQIGNGQIGAEGAKCGGATPSYGSIVRYPHYQPLFALQKFSLYGRYQAGLAIMRHVDWFASHVSFGCLLEAGKGLAPVLRFGSPRYLKPIYR